MSEPLVIIAEDDNEDWLLFEDALRQCPGRVRHERVTNGAMLLQRLRSGKELPDGILLDLRMPVMDGRTALREIRADENLRHLLVVVLTTSTLETDILETYREGANSYVLKPLTFEDMDALLRDLRYYWFDRVTLPPKMGDPQ